MAKRSESARAPCAAASQRRGARLCQCRRAPRSPAAPSASPSPCPPPPPRPPRHRRPCRPPPPPRPASAARSGGRWAAAPRSPSPPCLVPLHAHTLIKCLADARRSGTYATGTRLFDDCGVMAQAVQWSCMSCFKSTFAVRARGALDGFCAAWRAAARPEPVVAPDVAGVASRDVVGASSQVMSTGELPLLLARAAASPSASTAIAAPAEVAAAVPGPSRSAPSPPRRSAPALSSAPASDCGASSSRKVTGRSGVAASPWYSLSACQSSHVTIIISSAAGSACMRAPPYIDTHTMPASQRRAD